MGEWDPEPCPLLPVGKRRCAGTRPGQESPSPMLPRPSGPPTAGPSAATGPAGARTPCSPGHELLWSSRGWQRLWGVPIGFLLCERGAARQRPPWHARHAHILRGARFPKFWTWGWPSLAPEMKSKLRSVHTAGNKSGRALTASHAAPRGTCANVRLFLGTGERRLPHSAFASLCFAARVGIWEWRWGSVTHVLCCCLRSPCYLK